MMIAMMVEGFLNDAKGEGLLNINERYKEEGLRAIVCAMGRSYC